MDLVCLQLFQPLLSREPSAVNKLVAVAGDCSQLKLGLSAGDEALLAANVTHVFHAAASVRFDDPLPSAILLNTRGTREVVELAKKMSRLRVGVSSHAGAGGHQTLGAAWSSGGHVALGLQGKARLHP